MELIWNISNEPTHNIERQVRLRKFESDFDANQIKLHCVVMPVHETRLVRSTEVVLMATNENFVDSKGEDADADTEWAISEYDFLMQYLESPVILGQLFGLYVQRGDLKGRFN